MTDESRLNDMLERYGEICNQPTAAKVLGVSARTIARMLNDGRLKRIHSRVDVRSIVAYIETPPEETVISECKKRGRKPAGKLDFCAASRHRGVR